MNNEYVLEYLKNENKNFSFANFFTGENNDKRAVIIITPNQMFVTMNLKDNDDNVLAHEVTSNYIISAIYNSPFKGDSSISEKLDQDKIICLGKMRILLCYPFFSIMK